MKYGFLGVGNMGAAVARAVTAAVGPDQVLVSSRTRETAQKVAAELGCGTGRNEELAARCRYLFLGVKPQVLGGVLAELAPVLADRREPAVLVSMAAGWTLAELAGAAGGSYPVVRIMPNTPVAVGAGVVLYTVNDAVTPAQEAELGAALSGAGLLDRLPEEQIDAASAVAGCGPAFVSLFLEAMADGGVACGLPRAKALAYAAQTLAGTAALQQKTGRHPGQLKDGVCSPGGSTIQGVRTLEQRGLRSAVMEAVLAAWEKNAALGQPD